VGIETLDEDGDGIIFLKKMFDETKTIAEPKAQRRPGVLEADISNVQANMTPMVSGNREKYVLAE
jgi:flagellar basal body rod protein FlgF